ncbi:hypothetical protein F511_41663 [Dorcoceras hygrometricum]|uniref:Uncharacterized protein n=1 Tax=Dorcoceras hygrometricum TaxID=472368 RepID=A0A2Z7A746_9LAMI|nr:hypothetical protein F511_41663 [Dorcoceras hygrometricum]
MASSLFSNTIYVCFDSVLAMDNAGMVAMFTALEASGLQKFLGCPSVIFESTLVEFFHDASVRDDLVVSAVHGQQVLDMLSKLHLFVIDELKMQTQEHGLKWEKTCCSKVFEGHHRDRGAVISRSNTNFRSICWIRTKTMANGSLLIQEGNDLWMKIPRPAVSCRLEILRQRSYDDTLPPISESFMSGLVLTSEINHAKTSGSN